MGASISTISIPHATIPTQMFGNVNLQNAVMYINENFADVVSGVNKAISSTVDEIDGKADADHDHDEVYAKADHTHGMDAVTGLSAALDGKAELNHEHSQYLSSLPAHYHSTTEISGLDEALSARADKVHSHTIAQVEDLATQLGNKASGAYVDQKITSLGETIEPLARQVVTSYASDNTAVANVPKDVEAAPENETDAQKKARIGSSTNYAREDHKHCFSREVNTAKISSSESYFPSQTLPGEIVEEYGDEFDVLDETSKWNIGDLDSSNKKCGVKISVITRCKYEEDVTGGVHVFYYRDITISNIGTIVSISEEKGLSTIMA